jgi:hypothetical protein
MDVARLGNRNFFSLKSEGQSTVEYILLTAVIVALMTTIFNSARFKDFLGKNGAFARAIKEETQWNYRHGFAGRQPSPVIIRYPAGTHPTYYNAARGNSHFFGPRDKYPP